MALCPGRLSIACAGSLKSDPLSGGCRRGGSNGCLEREPCRHGRPRLSGLDRGRRTATAAADLRERLIALGQEEVEAIADVIRLTRRLETPEPDSPEARAKREHAVLRASLTPLEIAELAAEVAGLAAHAATRDSR